MLVFSTPLMNKRPSNLLTGSPTPPPPPFVNTYRRVYCIHTVCNGGGGADRGSQTDKHVPPSTFTGKFLRKADT
jgi:hypothetical protein